MRSATGGKKISGSVSTVMLVSGNVSSGRKISGSVTTPQNMSSLDYEKVKNKPAINDHELTSGENTLSDLGLGLAPSADITKLFN